MKVFAFVCILAVCAADKAAVNPIQKVIEMISDLETKIIGEGHSAQKLYEEFSEMCEDRSRELHFNIKTEKAEIADQKATIEEMAASIETHDSKIEELAGSISENEAELKAAKEIREKEATDFALAEKELEDTIDTIQRASSIIEREMQKGGSFVQLHGAEGLEKALDALVQASAINSADAGRLTALVQSSTDDEEDGPGAPDAATYESHSDGILESLESLRVKAEEQLADSRKEETTAKHNYAMKQQALDDEIKYDTTDMDKAKKTVAGNKESKATAEGAHVATTKDMKEDEKSLAELHHDCMAKASDFEDETKSRGEELHALATAKKIITEATGGTEITDKGQVQVSLLQVASSEAAQGALKVLRRLAFARKSSSLAQLAERVDTAMRGSSDPFVKVKGLIVDMVMHLEKEAEEDATHHAYCEKEMGETNANKERKSTEIEKMSTKIEQMSANSAKLKEEVATLQKELATLTREQAEMDRLRAEEHAAYETDRAELEQGLAGIKLALKVLRDYYAQGEGDHDSADGAAGGIIGLLEVCESDFSKGLAEMIAKEEGAAASYDAETKENAISKAAKEQDRKYKTKEAAALDKASAEVKSDRRGVQQELDAVNEYLKELTKECVVEPETYEERKARREAELAGLKEALEVLENDTAGNALIQRGAVRRTLRGGRAQLHTDA